MKNFIEDSNKNSEAFSNYNQEGVDYGLEISSTEAKFYDYRTPSRHSVMQLEYVRPAEEAFPTKSTRRKIRKRDPKLQGNFKSFAQLRKERITPLEPQQPPQNIPKAPAPKVEPIDIGLLRRQTIKMEAGIIEAMKKSYCNTDAFYTTLRTQFNYYLPRRSAKPICFNYLAGVIKEVYWCLKMPVREMPTTTKCTNILLYVEILKLVDKPLGYAIDCLPEKSYLATCLYSLHPQHFLFVSESNMRFRIREPGDFYTIPPNCRGLIGPTSRHQLNMAGGVMLYAKKKGIVHASVQYARFVADIERLKICFDRAERYVDSNDGLTFKAGFTAMKKYLKEICTFLWGE